MLPFLDKFKKEIAKLENVSTDFRPPSHWYSTSNYAVNKALSGDYYRGIPQGRITIFAGPSDTGKSFLLSNVMRGAQESGAFVLAVDSENALDLDYLGRIGVNTSADQFLGIQVVTISDVVKTLSEFIQQYEKQYGKHNPDAPKVLIAVDSLDMLLTDSENKHYEEGVQKGDQGQRAKQMKAFLRTTVARIKSLNIAFIATHQVYPADVLEGEGKWKINNAIRYSASQIVLITKLKLKDDTGQTGIRMYVETFKSRFAKPGTKVEVMVPYDKGMNPYSGLLEMMEKDGVIVKSGAWWNCTFPGEKPFSFQSTKMDKALVERLFSHPKLKSDEAAAAEVYSTAETPAELGLEEPTESTITSPTAE